MKWFEFEHIRSHWVKWGIEKGEEGIENDQCNIKHLKFLYFGDKSGNLVGC